MEFQTMAAYKLRLKKWNPKKELFEEEGRRKKSMAEEERATNRKKKRRRRNLENDEAEEENDDDNEELEKEGVVTEEEEEEEMSEEEEELDDEKECEEMMEKWTLDAATKRKLVDLFDNEASLSGDDVGSDSDGETQDDEPDEYEAEEGDLDQLPDTEEIRENLVRQYQKHQNDDSDRKIRRLKEAFLPDSELHGQVGTEQLETFEKKFGGRENEVDSVGKERKHRPIINSHRI
ncbi:hypothetical protein niasHT_018606 [Heterodera trifolii]|uniref:Uncharacterized protein n=1 Tax=Heterodera trifolii TaxID=157864 RepID=A0ABD2LBJ5_9BILA